MSGRGDGRGTTGGLGQPPQSRGGGAGGGRGSSAPASSHPSISEEMEKKLAIGTTSLKPLPPASTKAARHPPRPGYGTIGRKVMIRANHFLVNVADQELHHYDVSISPEITSKKVSREVITQLVKSNQDLHLGKRKLAYDGRKSCYSAGPLPFTSKEFVVKFVEKDGSSRKEREFKVSLKFASRADLHHLKEFLHGRKLDIPQETIQVLDVVLRENPSKIYEVVGRSFFHPLLGPKGELGDGLEFWKGFYQSVRPTQMGLSLNIDMSARAFYEPILVSDYVFKFFNRDISRPLTDHERVKLKKALKGVRVEFRHQDKTRRHKITGLSTAPVQQLMFSMDESKSSISVAEYFHRKYNIVLKYPFLPALQSGSDSKPAYLPMEVCTIVTGQRFSKKLNEKQVTALLRATCQRPSDRESNIKGMVRENDYNSDALVTEFGIQVRPDLASIEARVLPTPKLMYHSTGRESLVEPRVGSWNMIDKKMVNGARVNFWTCISFSRSNLNIDRFCNELISMCCSKGMEFNRRPIIPFRSVNPAGIENGLFDVYSESTQRLQSMNASGQLQLLIVILPDVTGSYGKIKKVCETELGIVSQCCQPRQAMKYNKQYMENVSLKINVKVGGRNTVLQLAHNRRIPLLTDRPTIVVGADVSHPSPGEDSSPSIASVVASMDWPEVTKYRALVSAQSHREEIIQDLYRSYEDPKRGLVHAGMIREHLIAFYKSTRTKPDRIIFYRDGVSEGQFNQVLLYEMTAIRKACQSLEEHYLPRVTFVVLQKRHNTRFFPAKHNERNETDRSGNILPGTVVDSKICHPTEFDFYLCSHAGIQGTSRPTHYHVLYDENGFTADALQFLTNNLCYTYARCTRSVSIVPPAYYAHLAAFRARYYLEGSEAVESGSSGGGGGGGGGGGVVGRGTRERSATVRPLPEIKDNVKEVMFYC